MKRDARRDCRIIGTNVLGKDVYKCSVKTVKARPKQDAQPKLEHRNAPKVQALIKDLFQSA